MAVRYRHAFEIALLAIVFIIVTWAVTWSIIPYLTVEYCYSMFLIVGVVRDVPVCVAHVSGGTVLGAGIITALGAFACFLTKKKSIMKVGYALAITSAIYIIYGLILYFLGFRVY